MSGDKPVIDAGTCMGFLLTFFAAGNRMLVYLLRDDNNMDHKQRAVQMLSRDRYARFTEIKVDEVSEFYAKCSLEVGDKHLNCDDSVMGGAIFTLADFTFGSAANSIEENCVTLSSSINFVRPATGRMLYAEAKCVKDGKNVCFFNVTVTDEGDRVIAEAQFNGFRVDTMNRGL